LRLQLTATFAVLIRAERVQLSASLEKKSLSAMRDFFRFFSSYDGFMPDRGAQCATLQSCGGHSRGPDTWPLICDQPARWASRRRRPHVTVDLTVADAHRSILTALNDSATRATFAKEDDP
jgi:hypothetical protein